MGDKAVAVTRARFEARSVDFDGVVAIGAGNRFTTGDHRLEGGVGGHLPSAGHRGCVAATGQYPRPEDHPVGQRVTAGNAMGEVGGGGFIDGKPSQGERAEGGAGGLDKGASAKGCGHQKSLLGDG